VLNSTQTENARIYNRRIRYFGAFFRENAKTLRFDVLIEKEGYMYKFKKGPTRRGTAQPKRTNLGEKLAKT
jgi:hypothetical protein